MMVYADRHRLRMRTPHFKKQKLCGPHNTENMTIRIQDRRGGHFLFYQKAPASLLETAFNAIKYRRLQTTEVFAYSM